MWLGTREKTKNSKKSWVARYVDFLQSDNFIALMLTIIMIAAVGLITILLLILYEEAKKKYGW